MKQQRLENSLLRLDKKPPEASVKLPPVVVSRRFREQAFEVMPALATDRPLRRFVQHLLFGVRRDKHTRGVLLPHELLADIEGVKRTGRYVAQRLLVRLRDTYLPDLRWSKSKFRPGPGSVRSVTHTGLPSALLQAAKEELASPMLGRGPRVYFDTGHSYKPSAEQEAREAARAAAVERAAAVSHPGTRAVLDYMNARKPHVFTKVVRQNIQGAYETLAAMERTELARMQALRRLRQVEAQPVPFYVPSRGGRTVRAFASGLLGLPGEVRQALTASWSWYDLQSAQLAIVAAQWDIPELYPFLPLGPDSPTADVWTSICGHMGPRAIAIMEAGGVPFRRLKRAFKGLVYGGVFGMGRRSLARLQTKEEHEADDHSRAAGLVELLGESAEAIGKRFISHPAIRALLKARKRRRQEVEAAGGAYDAFGVWVEVPGNSRSTLAQLAQAEELFLLMPVLELAQTTEDFQVVAWLHDGLAVTYANASKRARWERRIMQAVADRAREHGVRTYLVPQ